MAGESFRTEQTESSRAFSPVSSNPKFSDLWNLQDIRALNQRGQAQIASHPAEFYSPTAGAIATGSASPLGQIHYQGDNGNTHSAITPLPKILGAQVHHNAEVGCITPNGAESVRLSVSNGEMAGFQSGQQRGSLSVAEREQAIFGNGGLDFSRAGDVYVSTDSAFGDKLLIAQTPAIMTPTVPDIGSSKTEQPTYKISQGYGLEYSLELSRQRAREESHKRFDGKDAKNNDEFLDMFLNGSGNDRQEHTGRGDPILEQFIQSPGAQAMRDEYSKLGCPASSTKLGYGTNQAFIDTIAKPIGSSLMHGFTDLFDERHLGSVGTQIGGFGNPPKEYPWATANATRCNSDGKPDAKGDFVQYKVTNIAGAHSWGAHKLPDRPLGASGPYRSIIQVFSWMESIPSQANGK